MPWGAESASPGSLLGMQRFAIPPTPPESELRPALLVILLLKLSEPPVQGSWSRAGRQTLSQGVIRGPRRLSACFTHYTPGCFLRTSGPVRLAGNVFRSGVLLRVLQPRARVRPSSLLPGLLRTALPCPLNPTWPTPPNKQIIITFFSFF